MKVCFLTEDTRFHNMEIIECFIKLMCQRWIPKWVHSSIQVPNVLWFDGHVSCGSIISINTLVLLWVVKAMSLAISNWCYPIRSSSDLICDHQMEGFTGAWHNKGSSNSFLSQMHFCFHSAIKCIIILWVG